MCDNGNKPFDGDGKSIRDVLEGGLRFWRKDKVQRVLKTSEELLTIFLNNKIKSPLSVGKIGFQVSSELLKFYDSTLTQTQKSPVWVKYKSLQNSCIDCVPSFLSPLFLPYLDPSKMRIEVGEDPSASSFDAANILYSYPLSEEEVLYWVDNNQEASNILSSGDPKKAQKLMIDHVWSKYNNHVEINIHEGSGEFEFHGKSLLPWRYEGDQGPRLIDRWKKFYKAGVRRSVILHGPPGTGKSTLARQASKELDGRVLFVPVRILKAINNMKYFTSAVEILQPDILIIDDIDRLTQNFLDLLLGFFEETETKVPLLLATTNHLARLPDAIKRPGRFDEIWKIDPPNDDIRLRVISYLANLEGVSLKDEQAQFLSDIASERSLPGSHLREIVRRISVLGWKEAVSFTEDDLTFSSEWTQNQDPFDALPGSPIKDVKEGRVVGTGVLRKLYKGKGDDECSKGLDPDESERGVLTAQLGYYLDDLED